MVLTAKKGQFFIIGALLIASIITGYVVLEIGSIQTPQTQTPRDLFDRSMSEFPAAINHISAEDGSVNHMQQRITSYLGFQRHSFASHGSTPRSHALIGVPQGENITFLLSNFHGQSMENVQITVDGTTETRSSLQDGQTRVFEFSSVPQSMDVQLSFESERQYDQSFGASRDRMTGLFHLRLVGQDQTWQDTRIY